MTTENERPTNFQPERVFEILKTPELRISTASFVRIRDADGRFALLVNKRRAEQGEIWLSPPGGAIEADMKGIEELRQLLRIDRSAFKEKGLTETGGDLRFKMNGADANTYREWFLERRNREVEPGREMREELFEETGILDAAAADTLTQAKYALAGYGTNITERTLRLLEIFDAELPEALAQRLGEVAKEPDSPIYFVTEEEIVLGLTATGLRIADVSRTLLDPKATIEPFQ